MVIVLSHTVVASFLFYRNPEKFLCGGSSNLKNSDAEDENPSGSYEDVTTKLAQVQNFRDLHSVVPDAIDSLSSQSVCCVLFLQDVVQEELFADKDNKIRFPKHGLCCAAKQTRKTQRREEISPNDPITALLKQCNNSDPAWKPRNVVCQPVVLTEDKTIIAVIVACHKSGSEVDRKILSFVEKQILACYRRMCKCNGSAVEYTVGDHESSSTGGVSPQSDIKEAIIKLCGELYDQDATILQLKVLKFLEEQTKAEYAFLLLVAPETQELFCQVVGDKVLDVEVRFPGQSSGFSVALETKEPIQLQDIPLDKRKELEEELGIKPLQSFLCVPVTSRNSNNLIALACVVNKKNNEKFTNSDVYSIRQCFQYTATVLTSTLAFQNERKLKIQTQAMLQVARNLFQHLGEFSKQHGECPIDHPSIKSGYFMVDVVGHTYADYLLLGEHGRISHCRPCGDFYLQGDESYCKDLKHNVFINGQLVSPQLLNGEKELSEQNYDLGNRTNKWRKQHCSDDGSGVTPNLSHNSYSPEKNLHDVISNSKSSSEKDLDEKLKQLDEYAREKYGSEVAENNIKYLDRPFLTPISDGTSYKTPESFVTANDSVSDVSTITDSNTGSEDPYSSGEYDKVMYDNRSSSYTQLNSSIDVIVDRENFENYCKTSLSKSASYLTDYHKSENYTESKPDLNYAFLKQYEKKYIDKKSESDSSAEFMSTAFEESQTESCCDIPSVIHVNPMVIVEDTESHHQHVMSSHHIITSTPNVSSLSSIYNVEKYKSSLENLVFHKIQVPCTEAVPFQIQNDLTKLLREIMQEARNLTQAERCSVFLIDTETEELVAKVFDGITTDSSEVQTEIRMPITQGIAGHVATTGELLNIKDAYSHPLFYRGIDDSTGFRTRNILCFPIKDEKGVVMGVSQLCNKKTAQCFTQFDEDVASAFAVYCCISISHSLMYQKVIAAQTRSSLANELMMYHMKCLMYKKLQDTQHRNRLANELMIYHMQVSPEDVQMLIQSDIPPSEFWSSYFDKFNYPPREIADNDTALACFSMFEDLGFISRWRIKKDTLARFVLMVKKGYRSPPYHNWMHAFAVAHFCYLCIKNCNLTECLEDIELFALFVSCLCHDIDHRGTNNSFQTSSKSVLAALYSSEGSVLERHHFAQTMCIMNTEGCNIFENLTAKHYQKALDLVRDIILATDLAHHFKILGNIQGMAKVGFDNTCDKHHKLLLCLLMTAADLSDQTKPWDKTKHIADLIYREFFSQGDMEKSLGKEPTEMMDRERARIPTLQISFLDNIALPVYKVLNDLFPQAEPVRQVVEDNRRHWDKICALIQMKRGGSCEKMSYDQILALEEEELDNTDANSSEIQHNGS